MVPRNTVAGMVPPGELRVSVCATRACLKYYVCYLSPSPLFVPFVPLFLVLSSFLFYFPCMPLFCVCPCLYLPFLLFASYRYLFLLFRFICFCFF